MKTIKCVCPSCGAKLEINKDNKTLTCPYCGEVLLLDDETVHVKYDDMEKAGYEFEKGRQKAIREKSLEQKKAVKLKENKSTSRNKAINRLAGILFAIAFFPLFVTIYLIKGKKFKPVVRYVIISICWIIWAPFAVKTVQLKMDDKKSTIKMIDVVGQTLDVATENFEEAGITNFKVIDSRNNEEISYRSSNFIVDSQSIEGGFEFPKNEEVTIIVSLNEPDLIGKFISRVQDSLDIEFTNLVDFDPHDEKSEYFKGYYSSDYRGSSGKHGYLNGLPVTMIQYGSCGYAYRINDHLKIYAQFYESDIDAMYPVFVKAVIPEVTDEEIQSALEKYKNDGYVSLLLENNIYDYINIISDSNESGKILELSLDLH